MKNNMYKWVDDNSTKLIEMAEFMFDNPELGNEEYKASEMLCKYLEDNGFTVEKGIAGLETAFRAIYENGKDGPSIGLVCEYDALEQGHACGHHLQGPIMIGGGIALKENFKDKPFKLVVYGTPAEETTSEKIRMVREGYFNDIDVAMMTHASPGYSVDKHSMALYKVTAKFKGTMAHAAANPERGRSAMDGLLMAFNGIEYMREHVKDDVRMHYTVTNSGGAANVVPKEAEGVFYVRSYNTTYLDEVFERFKKVLQGAAMMTETEVEIIVNKKLDGKLPITKINDLMIKYMHELDVDDIRKPREKTGSADFGCISHKLPGSTLRVGVAPTATGPHTEEYLINGKGEKANTAINVGAKIIAAVSYDIITQDGLLDEIKKEYQQRILEESN